MSDNKIGLERENILRIEDRDCSEVGLILRSSDFNDLRVDYDDVEPKDGKQRYAPAHGSARMPETAWEWQA